MDIELYEKAQKGLTNLENYESIKLEFRLFDGKEIKVVSKNISPEDLYWIGDSINALLEEIPPVTPDRESN